MKLLDEKFEYLSHNLPVPKNKDFGEDYNSKEFRELELSKEYSMMMLNQIGAQGWELVTVQDDSDEGMKVGTIDRFIFKRSSHSQYFGTGLGVDMMAVERMAKEKVEKNHPNIARNLIEGLGTTTGI